MPGLTYTGQSCCVLRVRSKEEQFPGFITSFRPNSLERNRKHIGQIPFQGKSVHSVAIFTTPPDSYFRHARPTPVYMNGKILESQKLLVK